MPSELIKVGRNFWNIRASFKIGVVDIATQASLVKCKDGEFVMLDACELSGDVLARLDVLTDGGRLLKAILHLHPFHTASVGELCERFPDATLYGSERHKRLWPVLPWQELTVDDPELHALFADDFEFSVPAGVDFISANENVHFSSVLAFHKASKTIHVDDTLMFINLPKPLALVGMGDRLSFHPTLALALKKESGAADEFQRWAVALIARWSTAQNLCAAHTAPLLAKENAGDSVQARIEKALARAKWVLILHRLRYS